jgi:Uma2 family endonuclease
MATHSFSGPPSGSISVEEYLSTAYEPDCEYEAGVIVERNVGEFEHSYLQTILATMFTVNMERRGVSRSKECKLRRTGF